MAPSPKKDFPTEWKGHHCGIHDAGQYVARNQKEWKQMWDAAYSDSHPLPKAPKLPEGKMAIAIFTGTSSRPADINVSNVEETGGQTVVTWQAKDQFSMLAVMNNPYLLKWVDKTKTPVVFRQQTPRPAKPGRSFPAPGF